MKHLKGVLLLSAVVVFMLAVPAMSKTPTKSGTDFAKAQKPITKMEIENCFECHETVKDFYSTGKHTEINCISCHNGLQAHMDDNSKRPGTDFSHLACGSCHKTQMETALKLDFHRPARNDKSQPTGRSPIWFDKLMYPHGFSREHNATRPHALMLIDQYVVDRAFGGRFQPKKGWEYILEGGVGVKVWDVLENKYPEEKGQKVFLPHTATAGNPVCMSCKTADLMLDWPWMGDPGTGAPFDRTSNVIEMVANTNYSYNCFFCHDPHSTKPRIIHNALIQALERPEADTLWHNDPNRTGITVYTMGERGYDRKIAILDKVDSRLMCAQCHVEYNCNAGLNSETGEPIPFAGQITNHFPLKDVFGLYKHYYEDRKFADFRNYFSGALLWKGQHPEFESYYESIHSKLGVGCADCHMGYKNKKTNATSHFVQAASNLKKDTCLSANCHPKWTEEQAQYTIDSIKAYTKGRMRKAEFWLATLIDKIEKAKITMVDPAALDEARTAHSKAHILWEYWTAENSDGFHNPKLARESLAQSIVISQGAIAALDKAMNDKLAASK